MGKRIAIELLVAVTVGSVLGLLGPFETYRLGIGPRLAYWIFMIVAGQAIFRPTLIASDWLAEESGMPRWAAASLAIAIGSLPMTLLVTWLFTGFDLSRALHFAGLPLIYGQVLLISILTYGVYRVMFPTDVVVSPALQVPVPRLVSDLEAPEVLLQSPSRLEARLPAGFGPLLALSSEDHYVRAHSEASTTLILIRLRDAIAELDSTIEGMQVHRSWWVARKAVTGHKRSDRALRLLLRNGLDVPVSRERIAVLKSNGWF